MIITEINESIKLAFDSMRSNKLRSFLAALGVVIGISFVILMGWVLDGLDRTLADSINLMGQDMLYIDKWDWSGGKSHKDVQQRKDLTLQQSLELCSKMTQSEMAFPQAWKWNNTVKANNQKYEGLIVQGTKYENGLIPEGTVIDGRFFNQMEDQIGSEVAVLGFKALTTIFPDSNSLGKTIEVNGRKLLVIGVVKKQGTMMMDFVDSKIYIPLNTFLQIFNDQRRRSFSIALKAGKIEDMENVREEARGLMRSIRNIKPGQDDDFSINETKSFQSTVDNFRLYVWGIGIGMTILSFIVGIIGIMNIMFVSVAERTKEIGIRKAIGAKNRSILMQFIIESAFLCFMGAIIAFVVCSIIIYLIATLLPKLIPETAFLSSVMPYQFLIGSSIVSIFVGMLAGLIPAMRAAKLDPVDALRYE
jgi:putative ABC transport system permease protein